VQIPNLCLLTAHGIAWPSLLSWIPEFSIRFLSYPWHPWSSTIYLKNFGSTSCCAGGKRDLFPVQPKQVRCIGFGPVGCMAAGVGSTWGVLTDKSSSNGRQLGCEMFPLFVFLLAKRYCWWSSFF